ncbi:PAS domain-containing sensor histidine kinase [Rhizobium azibense]|uniref:histidine kinase n=1 Tax=Rhizobium azibense TaxID=1136135 RepID=A0A4R3RR27_9HYPH|nr:PAS domain-containing sensor histidine kinase [Rhizobium azibense]TCU37159.1 PAS/PAC sensor signal transduction histidine kinase [Rhizobium azibense]
MPAVQYPFIDIAVHQRVRERFSRGEAMVLFSADLSRLLWANGAGAELFGQTAVYDLLDQGVNRADITFRQIETTARQLATIGDAKSLMIRISKGFQRAPAQATAEMIGLSSGERGILLSVPVASQPLPAAESAARMLRGLDDPDTHMAVIGAEGEVIASSPGFASLGITQQTAKTLTNLAGAHPDRLVKRPVATGKGYLPAAVGKLSDEPALNLLFAVETVLGNLDPIDATVPDEPLSTAAVNHIDQPKGAKLDDALNAVALIEDVEEALEIVDGEETKPAAEAADEPLIDHGPDELVLSEPEMPRADFADPVAGDKIEAETGADPADAVVERQIEPDGKNPGHETEDGGQGKVAAPPTANGFAFKPNSRATRFVWKIDADGHFSEVSSEFADAVGPHAANIIGVAFSDIAALFNLDPEGKIAEALARRDTWSGKTIHWPIEGTSLIVPVDLAALPTYTRNREFDGFRGFGVVRLSDANEDPLALGLTLGGDAFGRDTAGPEQLPEGAAPPASDAERQPGVPEAIEQPEAVSQAVSREEPPVLRVVDAPSRRLTDKIIQLHGAGPTLSAAEQANFREIAKRLEAFGVRDDEPAPAEPGAAGSAASTKPAEAASEGAPNEAIFESASTAVEEPADAAEPEEHAETPEPSKDDATEGLHETFSQIEVLHSAIPPRVKMTDGLSAATVDQLPVAVLVHAGDALIHANPEFMRLTGYSSLEDLSDVGGIDALLQRRDLDEKAGRPGAMVLVTADDSLVPVTARLQSIRWEESSALMLALMPVEGSDVAPAQNKKTRPDTRSDRMVEKVAKLQVEVEELRSILETATDGVVVIGAEGDIRSMNRSASALFNYDEEETRGKPFVMLFAHESQKAVLDYLNGLSGHGVASVLNDGREVIGRESSGGFVPLFMTMGQLTSSSGYCAVIRDITQWKRTEEELRNAKGAAETANAHKTDFLARISHEIRTPLNAIIGFSDMMASERFGPIGHPRYIEYANDIGRSGRHVLDIVNDLLDISKIEAGEMDLDFASVGLNEAISEAVALVQPQANGQRVIIRTALSQSVPNVVADLRSIKQIALNILSNAIRFTPSGGQIVVSTSYEANGSVVLRVRDTGIGMTRSELDQAMKPFRQVSAQSRHRGDGTGLGLPLTKAMVDANRAIFAINSTPNDGTLVEVTFPSQRVLAG